MQKQKSSIVIWWKQKYNYSSNDPRYLEATMTQIYSDYLEAIIDQFGNIDNPLAKEIITGRAHDPDYDNKQSQAFKIKVDKEILSGRKNNTRS